MKVLLLISMVCLIGQAMLSACKQKDVVPSIDNLVGQYDCRFQWYGGGNIGPTNAKSFQIVKSKEPNMLEVQIDIGGGWQETWQLEYVPSLDGLLLMKKQITREVQSAQGYPLYALQKGSGKVFGDSLRFEGERYAEPGPVFGQTFCRYWAKKKS